MIIDKATNNIHKIKLILGQINLNKINISLERNIRRNKNFLIIFTFLVFYRMNRMARLKVFR